MAASITNMLRFSKHEVILCNKCWKLINVTCKRMTSYKVRLFPADVKVDTETIESLNRKIKKKNPGAHYSNKLVDVPEHMNSAIKILVQKFGDKSVPVKAEALHRYLCKRHLPVENDQLRDRAVQIFQEMNIKGEIDDFRIDEDEANQHHWHKLVKKRLRQEFYHWQAVEFDRYNSLMYIVGRMECNYSILYRVLEEIRIRDPDFVPMTVYNYGSGSCSAVWAIHEVWQQQKMRQTHQYYCEDPSVDMNTLARLLFQDGNENNNMRIKGVFIREKPPFDKSPFHMVVSAFTLLEQLTQEDRVMTVKKLWDATKDYLVLVEEGNFSGHVTIQEAKDFLLHLTSEEAEDSKAYVFGPCPHEKLCPKFSFGKGKSACSFHVGYNPSQINTGKGHYAQQKYCYVIMKKGPVVSKDTHWPRAVQPTVIAKKHIYCHLCCENGDLRHYVMTSSKTPKEVYRIGKRVKLGDRLPVDLSEALARELTEEQEKEEEKCILSKEMSEKDVEVELPDILTTVPDLPDSIENFSEEDLEAVSEHFSPEDLEFDEMYSSESENAVDDISSIFKNISTKKQRK